MRVLYRLRILLEHHLLVAAGIFVAVAGIVWMTGSLWPERYTASALIKTISIDPHSQSDAGLNPSTLKHDVLTDPELSEIAQRFHLRPGFIGIGNAAENLRSDISLTQVKDSTQNMLRLSYSGWNKTAVLGVTGALTESFVLHRQHPPPQAPADDVLQAQPAKPPVQAQVVQPAVSPEKESVLRRKLAANLQNVMDLQAELQASIQRLINLEHERQNAATARAAATATARAQEQAKRTGAEAPFHQQLADATKNLADLRQRYTEEHPDVAAAEEKVQEAQGRLTRAQNSYAASAPETLSSPLPSAADFELQEKQIRAQQAGLEESIRENREETARLQSLLRSQSPRELMPQAADAAIAPPPSMKKAIEPSPVTWTPAFAIQRDAVIEEEAAVISRQSLWQLSVALGLLAAMIAVILREFLDKSIKNEAVLRNELPHSATYIGAIPRIRHEIIAE